MKNPISNFLDRDVNSGSWGEPGDDPAPLLSVLSVWTVPFAVTVTNAPQIPTPEPLLTTRRGGEPRYTLKKSMFFDPALIEPL